MAEDIPIKTFSLKAGESHKSDNTTLTLIDARTKWTTTGNSALVVSAKLTTNGATSDIYITRTAQEKPIEVSPNSRIHLVNGDNNYAKFQILEWQRTPTPPEM